MNNWNAQQPYNDLPNLPPCQDVETKAILKKCIIARAKLAELKQAGELIPNQAILINIIPLLESKASSEIENIVTTTDELFKYAHSYDDAKDSATKETLRYRTALYHGINAIKERPLSMNTAIDICSMIKGVDLGIRATTGTALTSSITGQVIYTPPVGEQLLRDKLSNLEHFLHYHNDLDPLIKMAIAHYQFEAIHPFIDGNGRTGRIINVLYLMHENLLTLPILYLSRYIIQNKARYYELLLGITTQQDWITWIDFILQGVIETSDWTINKINEIRALQEHTILYVQHHAKNIYSRELIDVLFEMPYCRISNLVDKGIAKRQSASNYLKRLTELGILNEVSAGKEKIFLHPKLLNLLTSDNHTFNLYE